MQNLRFAELDIQGLLRRIEQELSSEFGKGQVCTTIPELQTVPGSQFGMAVATVNGDEFVIGAAETPFSIQSLSKVFVLEKVLQITGASLWERVGREPSGLPFNSLALLEIEGGVPRNPFINAGALVLTDHLAANHATAEKAVLQFVQSLSANDSIAINERVAKSEKETGGLNFALAHLLRSRKSIAGNVDQILDTYIRLCALEMSCLDLARAFTHLANNGVCPRSGQSVLPELDVRRVNALMLTCGLYDGVGNFAYRVGIPAKSGVGGGVVGVIPRVLSVAVWAPELDAQGNSLAGISALELFTKYSGWSIF